MVTHKIIRACANYAQMSTLIEREKWKSKLGFCLKKEKNV